ncbi:MAG TPA: twin-arginine translocation signal domain-containing protein [Draconibacterium sp.]|nr:twin-arginine translocation signal domain-containing protein [Draconibacterium sp.]
MNYNRRNFLKASATGAAAVAISPKLAFSSNKRMNVEVVNPKNRVPVSLIIDDSTTLVNMAHYGIPQFAEVFPENYKQDWRKLPREIPDSFVREFGEWSAENGVKGKYSIVPYPACTGWVNRFIPGWTKRELEESLKLIRDVIVPNWDIHPEMVSHTRVIDIKTGKPYPQATPEFMENWEWSQNKSADELAAYQAYALNILKEAGLYCEGLTTPGGYGGRNQDNLALGTLQAVSDVYNVEISHYFRDLFTEKGKSVAPQVRFTSGLESADPKCVVSILGCTGDWFGGWDGLEPGDENKFITTDLQTGRMVDVIESGEPAIMVCHWPGIYYNGEKLGFNILKEIKRRLDQKYNHLTWMKLSEISRYWAAKELTILTTEENTVKLKAPFAAPDFTLRINASIKNPTVKNSAPIQQVHKISDLKTGTFYSEKRETFVCFDLKKGETELIIQV